MDIVNEIYVKEALGLIKIFDPKETTGKELVDWIIQDLIIYNTDGSLYQNTVVKGVDGRKVIPLTEPYVIERGVKLKDIEFVAMKDMKYMLMFMDGGSHVNNCTFHMNDFNVGSAIYVAPYEDKITFSNINISRS